MSSDKEYFSEEYNPKDLTKGSDSVIDANNIQKAEKDLQIEQKKYGEAKPKRIIIKARLLDD